jgi:c-di-GMP-binding flagellar brake protein YcgR
VIFKRTADTRHSTPRRVLRREVDWPTKYLLEGSRERAWRECQILDLSRGGAGVVLYGASREELSAHSVIIELEVPPATLRIRGDVRHLRLDDDGALRVGLQFGGLSVLERDLLDSLLDQQGARK